MDRLWPTDEHISSVPDYTTQDGDLKEKLATIVESLSTTNKALRDVIKPVGRFDKFDSNFCDMREKFDRLSLIMENFSQINGMALEHHRQADELQDQLHKELNHHRMTAEGLRREIARLKDDIKRKKAENELLDRDLKVNIGQLQKLKIGNSYANSLPVTTNLNQYQQVPKDEAQNSLKPRADCGHDPARYANLQSSIFQEPVYCNHRLSQLDANSTSANAHLEPTLPPYEPPPNYFAFMKQKEGIEFPATRQHMTYHSESLHENYVNLKSKSTSLYGNTSAESFEQRDRYLASLRLGLQ